MPLREKISEQFVAAQKDKNKTLISTLRLILADIKERYIASRSAGNKEMVNDTEIIKVFLTLSFFGVDSFTQSFKMAIDEIA